MRSASVRIQARCKATDVMIDLLRSAQTAGISAKYVLFDSWFSSPKTVLTIRKDLHLDTIAMIKKSIKVKYEYNVSVVFRNICKMHFGRLIQLSDHYFVSNSIDYSRSESHFKYGKFEYVIIRKGKK